MYRSFFFLLTACLIFVAAQQANSATKEKDEAITELLQAMNTIENMDASLKTMEETIKVNSPYFLKEIKVILARSIDDEAVQKAADLYRQEEFGAARLYELYRYKLSLDRIISEVMLPVYDENYTIDEIRELTRFYKSAIGQKTLRLRTTISGSISSKIRDISQMALNHAKEELAFELQKKLDE